MKHKEIHTPRSGGVIGRHGNRALRLLTALALVAAAMILAVPAAAQHTPDANTVLLDSLDGTTVGTAYGTVSYEPSLPILGQAVDLETGDWIKYAVPSWYSGQGSGTGTVETWIYPRSHNIGLGTLQWFNVSTGPSSGYLGGLSITVDGHLRWSTWRAVSAGGDIPVGSSVIPLNEWTHIAATWGPAGTSLYVNGILDAYSVGNHDPYLISTLYIYLNGWGDTDLGLVDEYRVSKTARSEAEIRDYVVEILNSAPVSDPNGPYLGAMGDEIVFDGTASSNPDNDLLVYNWDWGDGVASPNAGATPTHIFVESGMYDVCLTVNDGYEYSDEVCTTAVVYDPDGGFVTGGGWIESPDGESGKATFGFVSKYKKGATAPTGSTQIQLHAGDLNFHSTSYDWLVVTGSNFAKFKGEGTINGEGVYKFQIWAGDDDPDTFRIKIWTEDEFDVETVIYDNGMNQAIGGGNIGIHTKK